MPQICNAGFSGFSTTGRWAILIGEKMSNENGVSFYHPSVNEGALYGTKFESFEFMDTETLSGIKTDGLRAIFYNALQACREDLSAAKNSDLLRAWQEEIAYMLRESQVRKNDNGETLYDREFVNSYRQTVYGN